MKAQNLISCILFFSLLLLLLSTTTQATEYRKVDTEIRAEDILEQIENGNDIYLDNCIIVGDLNSSKMKLETALNPFFRSSDGSFPRHEDSTILYVIESNIKITNSNFDNDVIFQDVMFKKSISFQNSTFNDTSFNGAVFNSYADFSEVNFKNNSFRNVNFISDTSFYATIFEGFGDFSFSDFNGLADFNTMKFEKSVDFSNVNFNGGVFFNGAIFNDGGTFEYANFNNDTDFSFTQFNGVIIFYDSNFTESSRFFHTYFTKDVHFDTATFSKKANFDDADFNPNVYFDGPRGSANIITNNAKTCELFRTYYKNTARYEDSDNIYYNYRKECQAAKQWTNPSKWLDIFTWMTCGYGLKPLNSLLFGGLIILFFAAIYLKGKGIYRTSEAKEQDSFVSVWDAIYFSIIIFTTVGSVDWHPKDNFRKWVTFEGLLGWLMLGIFMATLTNVMIRA